jgi:hypothetical protein
MGRLLAILAVLAALLLPAGLLAGCGSDDLPSVSAAEAAQSTREAHTARATLRMELKGMGLPRPTTMSAKGVTATDAPRLDMTFDLEPLLGQGGKARVMVDGGRVFVEPPQVPGLDLPGDARWVALELGAVADALGVDGAGLGEIFRMSPAQQLAALEAAGSVKRVGEEKVRGVRTTHLRGTVTLRGYARGLPPARRAQLNRAIRQIAKVTGEEPASLDQPTATDMWVDKDAHVRRLTQTSRIPAQQGVPSGSVRMTMEFTDFGTPLKLDLPAGGEVFDATELATRELRKRR